MNTHTHRQTHRQTHGRTFRLIESIGPKGRCFEKVCITLVKEVQEASKFNNISLEALFCHYKHFWQKKEKKIRLELNRSKLDPKTLCYTNMLCLQLCHIDKLQYQFMGGGNTFGIYRGKFRTQRGGVDWSSYGGGKRDLLKLLGKL